MKLWYTFPIFLLLAGPGALAQQQEQFTQFMHNRLVFNPGAAGSEQTAVIAAQARNQWLGLEGAPETQLLTFNMPLFRNHRVGVGASVMRQTIGLSEDYEMTGVYTYRIKMGRGWLGTGLQASVHLLRTDFTRAEAVQPIESDAAVPPGIESKYVPNFGAGLYYQESRFYLGIGVPRLLQNNIDLADEQGVLTREIRHFYVIGGLKMGLNDLLDLRPNLLLKYVKGAPFDADVNLTLGIMDKFTAGLSYRIGGSKVSSIGESVSLLVGCDIGDYIQFGLSYDATLSELRRYNNGTVEGILRYRVGGKSKGVPEKTVNARDFF